MNAPQYVFINQATSRIVYELAQRVSEDLGPTLVISGNRVEGIEESPNLTIWDAPKYDNSSYPSRLRAWTRFMFSAERLTRRIQGTPTVLMSSNPPFMPWLGARLERRGWRCIMRVLDVYPDAVVSHGLLSEGHPIVRGWTRLNGWTYGQLSSLITLGPVMGERLRAQTDQEITLIPDWVDTDWIRPVAAQDNAVRAELGLGEELVVLYSGNLGLTHDIRGWVTAMENTAKDEGTPIRHVLIGGGGRAGEFKKLAERFDHVDALPFQPEERVPMAMASGDVGVVTLGDGTEGVSMPSKAYFMMAAGCALLGLTKGDNDVARLIERYECGINVDCSDGVAVTAALRRFHEDRDFLERCQRNARRAAETEYSADSCIARYLQLLGRT